MTTNFVPALWIVWGCVALVTAALFAYRSSLTRDEEGQIFLDEAFDHEKAIQTEIVRKVNRLQPVVRLCLILTAVTSLLLIVYYGWDAAHALFG